MHNNNIISYFLRHCIIISQALQELVVLEGGRSNNVYEHPRKPMVEATPGQSSP